MKILVIAAHPDDETLGCGGTLLKHQSSGDELHWLIVTRATARGWSKKVITKKAAEIRMAAKAYGMKSFQQLGFPSTYLDSLPQAKLIDAIRKTISKVRPQVVYVVHGGDIHTDHKAVFTAVFSVLKSFYMRKWGVQRILCYETLSSTEAAPAEKHRVFMPTVFSDITPFMKKKLNMMAIYKTETQKNPMPRGNSAIQALARYRGATIGVSYAEAFMLIREVI